MVILDTKCELVNHWPKDCGAQSACRKVSLGYVSLPNHSVTVFS